jgi:hypothetical protein
MGDIIGRCGYRCSLCLIHRDNLREDLQNRRECVDGLKSVVSSQSSVKSKCQRTNDKQNPKA